MNLIEEFRQERKMRKITVKILSKLSSVPVRTIANWELKKAIPTIDNFNKVLNSLGYELKICKKD